MKVILTGSEGVIGKQLFQNLSKTNNVKKLDLLLGHDLTDENFVKTWFKKNKADCLINCFALNDHVDNKRKKQTSKKEHNKQTNKQQKTKQEQHEQNIKY